MSIDIELQKKIVEELTWDPSIDATHITVAVKDSIATLSGYVPRFADKENAEQATKRVANVKAVVDEVEVKLAGSFKRTDLEIAEMALKALQANSTLPKDKVKVTVADGWVTLDGEVEWHYQQDSAASSVRYLSGVKGVTNKMTIKPTVHISDIKSKIRDALVRNAQIDANNINVGVNGGMAVLDGKVKSWAEKEQAGYAAWSAPGVTSVQNNISIR